MIMYGLQILFALHPNTNSWVDQPIDIKPLTGFDLPFKLTWTYFIAGVCSALPAVQYNAVNLYEGYKNSKDKLYAVLCAIPFFQLIALMYLASVYSQFWHGYTAIF